MKTIKISYKKQEYNLSLEKLICIFNILENKKQDFLKEEEIIELMKKYNLFDDIFLKNINKI